MNQQEKLTGALRSLEAYKERHLVPSYFLNALADIRAVLAAASSPLPAEPAQPQESPRCPKCGYVMCQQFDSRPVNALADIATPNGTYICYHCTDVAPPQPEGEQESRKQIPQRGENK